MAERTADEVGQGLVGRLSSKDPAVYEPALAELLGRHGPAVLTFVERRVPDADLVRSIVEETFVALAVRPHSFDGTRQTLRSYLVGEAHRLSSQALDRAEGRARPEGADEVVRRQERLAIDLALLGEMTYGEIAELLGISPQAALNLLTSGLETLAGKGEVHAAEPG